MRRLMAFGAAAVVGAVLFMGAPAFAATGYPPPTVGTPPPTALLTATSVTCPVGSTCTLSFSGFLPGSTVQIFVAGTLAANLDSSCQRFLHCHRVRDRSAHQHQRRSIDRRSIWSELGDRDRYCVDWPGRSVSGTVTIPSPASNTGTGGAAGRAEQLALPVGPVQRVRLRPPPARGPSPSPAPRSA